VLVVRIAPAAELRLATNGGLIAELLLHLSHHLTQPSTPKNLLVILTCRCQKVEIAHAWPRFGKD